MTTPLQELHVACKHVAMETVTCHLVVEKSFLHNTKANFVLFYILKNVSAGSLGRCLVTKPHFHTEVTEVLFIF